jgi:hypothetical protein
MAPPALPTRDAAPPASAGFFAENLKNDGKRI